MCVMTLVATELTLRQLFVTLITLESHLNHVITKSVRIHVCNDIGCD